MPDSRRRPIWPGNHGWPRAPRPTMTASAPDISSADTAFSNVVMSPLTTNGMRTYSGRLASQPRHRATIDEVIAGSHLGNGESGAKHCSQTTKRCISDAGHRREKDPVGDLNIAYFQRLSA